MNFQKIGPKLCSCIVSNNFITLSTVYALKDCLKTPQPWPSCSSMRLLQLAGRGRGSASQRVSSRFSSRSRMYPSCGGWQLYITPSDYLHDWVLHFLEVVVLFILTSKCACVNALLRQRYDLLRFIIAFVFSFPPLRYLVAYILKSAMTEGEKHWGCQ